MSWRWLCSETRDSARAFRVAILGDGGFEGFALESAKETISRPWMSRAVQFEEDCELSLCLGILEAEGTHCSSCSEATA
jgi:hypothetical protein